MNKKLLLLISAVVVFLTGTAFIITSTGVPGQTGSPGEQTCNQCHSGGVSIASGATITAIPGFTNSTYIPGQTYTVNVIVGAIGFNNFGFGCEILNSSNSNAGTIQNPGAGVKFMTAGNGRQNAVHTIAKAGTGFASFSFEWVAPSTGAVNIYAAGNAVNLNGNTSGDLPVSATLALTSPTVSSLNENKLELVEFNFFPNPTKDILNLSYNLQESGSVSLDLYSINGQLITNFYDEKQNEGLNKKVVKIPSAVSPGVYFLKTSVNGKQVLQKLISIQ